MSDTTPAPAKRTIKNHGIAIKIYAYATAHPGEVITPDRLVNAGVVDPSARSSLASSMNNMSSSVNFPLFEKGHGRGEYVYVGPKLEAVHAIPAPPPVAAVATQHNLSQPVTRNATLAGSPLVQGDALLVTVIRVRDDGSAVVVDDQSDAIFIMKLVGL